MITEEQAMRAVGRMSILRFFPSDPYSRSQVAALLLKFVDRADGLEWLVNTMLNQVGEWPGPKELRALYCCKFKPADGIEAYSAIRGFTPEDIEAENLAKLPAWSDQPRLGEMRPVALILGPDEKM